MRTVHESALVVDQQIAETRDADLRCEEASAEEASVMLQLLGFSAFLEQHGPSAARALVRNFERQVHEREMREIRDAGEQLVGGLAVLLLGDAELEARKFVEATLVDA